MDRSGQIRGPHFNHLVRGLVSKYSHILRFWEVGPQLSI
jgi:hypothetical protein